MGHHYTASQITYNVQCSLYNFSKQSNKYSVRLAASASPVPFTRVSAIASASRKPGQKEQDNSHRQLEFMRGDWKKRCVSMRNAYVGSGLSDQGGEGGDGATLAPDGWFLSSNAEHVLLIPSHIHVCAESDCPLNCLNLSDCVTISLVLLYASPTIASSEVRLASFPRRRHGARSIAAYALAHIHLYSKWGPRITHFPDLLLRWISCIEKNPRYSLISRICKKMFST